jgi:hypothetical protein
MRVSRRVAAPLRGKLNPLFTQILQRTHDDRLRPKPVEVSVMPEPARLRANAEHRAAPYRDAPVADAAEAARVLDTEVAEDRLDLASCFRTIAAAHGKSYQQLLLEIARTSFGPGRLSFHEYLALRLFDDPALAGADKSAFVGIEGARRIWAIANHNSEWWGVMANKLAITALLHGYGFCVIPTLALYSDKLCLRNATMLRGPAELLRFLRTSNDYPLFAKPMNELRSLGAASLDAYHPASDSLLLAGGKQLPLERFVEEVARHFAAGYILQRRLSPHPAVRALAGERLATVRVMTICTREGPQILRAAWKIPGGDNFADNFWRNGNLLATLDLQSGRVIRVVRGSGLAQKQLTHHPDSDAPLIGIEVPQWQEITALALEAAASLKDVRLIGWDLAATDRGVVIVEPNYTPDFGLPQLADRRGLLDDHFKAFLADCKVESRDVKKEWKRLRANETRAQLARVSRSIAG